MLSSSLSLFVLLFCSTFIAAKGPPHGHPPPAVHTVFPRPPYTRVHNDSFVPDAILRVTIANYTQSCMDSKMTVLVNGTAPGPELRIAEGETTWIRVYNDMDAFNLTMHWHGLSMAVSPFADGTPQVSQWPIPPDHYFDYEIRPEDGSAGTYFYHSHVGFQAVSCAGPLIVEDNAVPYTYGEEKIVFISDVFPKTDQEIEEGLQQVPFVWSGETGMVMINGLGGGLANGTFCNATLAVIDVEADTLYRFRFIGGTALTFAHLLIEDHSMSIIEADGQYTQQLETDYIQIGTGQRYSALVKTLSNPRANGTYIIQIQSLGRPTITIGYAILRYSNCPNKDELYPPLIAPYAVQNQTTDYLEYALAPLYDNDFPSAAEVTRRITMVVHQSHPGMIIWSQNEVTWTEEYPTEPYLVSLYKNDGVEYPSMERALANGGVDPQTRTWPAQIGEVLEIVIQNSGSFANSTESHPFHAHGRHYHDCGSGPGLYDAEKNEARLQAMGHAPVLRDTTMLFSYDAVVPENQLDGWRAWRLRVTEPGAWMVHCHILQHMIMGMQTVWVFGNQSELLGLVPEPEVNGYLAYGGDVYGTESHPATVVHFQDYEDWEEDQ